MTHARSRVALLAATALAVSLLVGGCTGSGPGGETTCAEFVGMGSDSGLGSELNEKQKDVLAKMLSEEDREGGQEDMAHLQVIQYCNIVGNQAGAHANDPINGIPGLQ